MDLNSLIKLVIVSVIFPMQASLIEPEDYLDAWWQLDVVVNSITEQIEQPEENDAVVQSITIGGK